MFPVNIWKNESQHFQSGSPLAFLNKESQNRLALTNFTYIDEPTNQCI